MRRLMVLFLVFLCLTVPATAWGEEALSTILSDAAAPAPANEFLPEGWLPRPWDGGSISVGEAAGGYLLHGAELAVEGEHWTVLPATRERRLLYGTDELVAAVQKAAADVVAQHPGARLVVANLSRDIGGPIKWSNSHQAGRDVDLIYYRVDEAGTPLEPTDFHYYVCNGSAEDKGSYRFDAARNWALVESLVTNPSIQVQYMFVSNCLRRLLLDYAREVRKAPADVLERAGQVLWRPSDAPPHRDHFHVRIYCSPDDLHVGCADSGRYWDWVPTQPTLRVQRTQALFADLRSKKAETRRAAAEALGAEFIPEGAGRLAPLLDDPDPSVRAAAARALVLLDGEPSYARIVKLLRPPTDLARFERGLQVLSRLHSNGSAWRLEHILKGTYEPLEALKPDRETRTRLERLAARGLGLIGRLRSFPALLRALVHEDEGVRQAARRALRRFVNQRPAAQATVPAEVQERWEKWWRLNRDGRAQRWRIRGFRAAGHRMPFPGWDWDAVPHLLAVVGAPEELGWNAHHMLGHIAKGAAVPYHPDDSVRAARWHAWWWGGHRWRAMKDK